MSSSISTRSTRKRWEAGPSSEPGFDAILEAQGERLRRRAEEQAGDIQHAPEVAASIAAQVKRCGRGADGHVDAGVGQGVLEFGHRLSAEMGEAETEGVDLVVDDHRGGGGHPADGVGVGVGDGFEADAVGRLRRQVFREAKRGVADVSRFLDKGSGDGVGGEGRVDGALVGEVRGLSDR